MSDTAPLNAPPFQLVIEGEMTIWRAAELKPQLLAPLAEHTHVDADLSAVTDFDSAGLQLLYLAQREAFRQGCVLRIMTYSHPVSSLIEAYRLPELLRGMVDAGLEAQNG